MIFSKKQKLDMIDFDFDRLGNLQPYQLIQCNDITVLERFFVKKFFRSETRFDIFNGFLLYISDLRKILGDEWIIWIDGSFTTTKPNPGDVDILNIFQWNEEINSQMNFIGERFFSDNSKKRYLVDGYFVAVYPKDDLRYIDTIEGKKYWEDWFGKTRRNALGERKPKGIIEIKIVFDETLIDFINRRIKI